MISGTFTLKVKSESHEKLKIHNFYKKSPRLVPHAETEKFQKICFFNNKDPSFWTQKFPFFAIIYHVKQ